MNVRKVFGHRRRPSFLGLPRHVKPLSNGWGYDRGTPIDRYYIERFLDGQRHDIRGSVLEVADPRYTERFGTDLKMWDTIDVAADNPRATLVADLEQPGSLPEERYDCFIATQTLQFVFNLAAATEGVHRVLKPGGTALVTVPSVSRIAASAGVDREFWRFTAGSCVQLFQPYFEQIEVQAFGNVLTCAAFLYGMAAEELSSRELGTHDPHFPLLIAVRAVKALTA